MQTMRVLVVAAFAAVILLGGCATPQAPPPVPPAEPVTPDGGSPGEPGRGAGQAPQSGVAAWSRVVLTDAVTGDRFRLSDLKGEPVLLHAFAVW